MNVWQRTPMVLAGCAAALGCDPVELRLGRTLAERDGPTVSRDASVGSDGSEGVEACPEACVGGRRCAAGECLPHWLPVEGAELANDAPRVGHFAVWTGTEVIVWGGHDPTVSGARGVYGDGFRYDPARGEVRVLSGVQSPSARFHDGGQTAVWTGREMIVWGGRSAVGSLADGWAYVPSADRWRPLGTAPLGGSGFTVVFTGTELLLWGAQTNGSSGLRFELATGAWAPTMPMDRSFERSGHTAIWTGSEMVVWGGRDRDAAPLRDGWRYLPARERWRAVDTLTAPEARSAHTSVWTGDEMLVFGGIGDGGRLVSEGSAYVPAANRWRSLGSRGAPSARAGHVAVWDGREMFVWGGADGERVLSDGAAYDPIDDVWRAISGPGSSVGRTGAQAVWTGSEILVVGGTDGGPRLSPIAWRFQP